MTAEHRAPATILVVEDDGASARVLLDLLGEGGYRVWHAQTGGDARLLLRQFRPHLVLLDLILPDVDGLVLCAQLKAQADVSILILSATQRRRDVVLGLKLGADDFVTKPYDVDDLLARVEAVLRRSRRRAGGPPRASPAQGLRVGSLVVDPTQRRVLLGGAPVRLTPTEHRLIAVLASQPGAVVSREELARRVCDCADVGDGRIVDVHVRRLRLKLLAARGATRGVVPPSIVAVRGYGYRLSPGESATTAARASASPGSPATAA